MRLVLWERKLVFVPKWKRNKSEKTNEKRTVPNVSFLHFCSFYLGSRFAFFHKQIISIHLTYCLRVMYCKYLNNSGQQNFKLRFATGKNSPNFKYSTIIIKR